jgi:hypothetical protein
LSKAASFVLAAFLLQSNDRKGMASLLFPMRSMHDAVCCEYPRIMRALQTILLLIGSNCFMTFAWYGHLKKAQMSLLAAIGISWLIALPEYILQVPANRYGHTSFGGPFTAPQLKILQEAITMIVFVAFSIWYLGEKPRWNEYVALGLIMSGVVVAILGR